MRAYGLAARVVACSWAFLSGFTFASYEDFIYIHAAQPVRILQTIIIF
jgi:hypothetical protein